jgi:hypothetical protein
MAPPFALLLSLSLLLSSISLASVSAATTWPVSVQQPGGLRLAVQTALAGDVILLGPGTFSGLDNCNITVSKQLTIRGAGRDATIVDCSGLWRCLTAIGSLTSLRLESMQLSNGVSPLIQASTTTRAVVRAERREGLPAKRRKTAASGRVLGFVELGLDGELRYRSLAEAGAEDEARLLGWVESRQQSRRQRASEGQTRRVVKARSSYDVAGLDRDPSTVGGCVMAHGARLAMRDCRVRSGRAGYGGGVGVLDGELLMENTVLENSTAQQGGCQEFFL